MEKAASNVGFSMPFLTMHNNKKASIISHNSNFFRLMADYNVFSCIFAA